MPKMQALNAFIADVRAIHAETLDEPERWARIGARLPPLLSEPELIRKSADWPVEEGKSRDVFNLLFYEDPDYGFVVNGMTMVAGMVSMLHDHAPTWTAFGVISGEEEIVHYRRAAPDDHSLIPTGRFRVGAGFSEVVPPDLVHGESIGAQNTAMLIVRSAKIGSFLQNMYVRETGELDRRKGPRQIPYEM